MLLLWLVYLIFINRRLSRKTCPRPMSTTACARLMRGWGPLFRLGLPGLATGAAQALALMLVLLAAGWIRTDDSSDPSSSSSTLALAALVVLASLASLGSAVAAGVGVAAGNMVATRLGAGKAQEARHVARAAVLLAALLAAVEASLLLGWPRGLAAALSSDPAVQNSFSSLGAAPALMVAADMLAGVQGGVLRGLGLQAFSAHATLAAYAFIGAPLGLALAFPMQLGARGLAWGLVGAAVALASLYGWHLYGRDWEHECALSVQRIEEEEGGRDAAEMLAADSDIEDEGMADMRREHGFGAH
jgi:MATE family multidrug resistance protein